MNMRMMMTIMMVMMIFDTPRLMMVMTEMMIV